MFGIDRGTRYGFSLWEFGVYEDSLATAIYKPVDNPTDIKIYPKPFDLKACTTEINISLPGIKQGMYFVIIQSDYSVTVKKLVKC
jgi:hypothetical protein